LTFCLMSYRYCVRALVGGTGVWHCIALHWGSSGFSLFLQPFCKFYWFVRWGKNHDAVKRAPKPSVTPPILPTSFSQFGHEQRDLPWVHKTLLYLRVVCCRLARIWVSISSVLRKFCCKMIEGFVRYCHGWHWVGRSQRLYLRIKNHAMLNQRAINMETSPNNMSKYPNPQFFPPDNMIVFYINHQNI